jgi:hypothetical protein
LVKNQTWNWSPEGGGSILQSVLLLLLLLSSSSSLLFNYYVRESTSTRCSAMLSSLNYENKCTPKNENKELSSFWDAVDLAYDEFIVKVFWLTYYS